MNEDERRDLIERVHQMQELELHPGWPLLVDFVTANMVARQRRLLNGNVETIEDYKAQVGWLSGAQFVLSATKELAAQLEREILNEAEAEAVA